MTDTQIAPQSGFTTENFQRFLASRDEPGWLRDQRRAAWDVFCKLPMPSQREEEWMRTDIRLLKLDRYALSVPEASPAADPGRFSGCLREDVELAGFAVSLNGRPVHTELADRWARQGVIFSSLEDAVRDHPELVRPAMFSRALNPHQDKFAALHAACWSSGSFLYVPRGVVVEQPLHALHGIADHGTDLAHTLVVLEDGAEASFLSEFLSPDPNQAGFFCGGTELILEPGSRLRFVGLQDWGHGVWHFGHQKAVVTRDASLQWTVGALGSRLSKVNQHVALAGPGAESQVNGVLFTEGRQHLSYHTLQHHEAPHCRSDFLYKAALQDRSRTVWRGMIKVDRIAQKTDGYQRNDNLLLSREARADAIPGLEIEADDVRCTHGSTTGAVDDELIFYAQCRGFTRKEAIRLIVSGFFQQVFDRITIDSVREALSRAVARRVREYE
jgi:Fe-S cluster assembly protein SufD